MPKRICDPKLKVKINALFKRAAAHLYIRFRLFILFSLQMLASIVVFGDIGAAALWSVDL